MIQFQYYHKGLTKIQIEHILNNYKLKYTTITNEINSKLNYLIKTVLNDISPFLENIEDISKELKNLREMDNHKKKIETLENKLHEKSLIESQLQNDIINLKKEISSLKEKNLTKSNSNENLLNKTSILASPKKRNRPKRKSIDINSCNDNQSVSSDQKTPRKHYNNKSEENSSSAVNSHSNSLISKKENPKNKIKNNYMMNMKEITRSINGYHNKVQANRNNEKMTKFICYTNKKNSKSDAKSSKPKKDKSKSMDISSKVDTGKKNQKMREVSSEKNFYKKNNKEEEKNNIIIEEEDIEEEIKELEIDEENILQLIEDIQNFAKKEMKV